MQETMQDLITSVMKFSTAVTLFSMQQVQNALDAASDTQSAIRKFREALDSVTSSLASHMDESKKTTLDSMSQTESDLVQRSFDAADMQAFDPQEMINTTGELMRKTSDSVADMIKKAPSKAAEPKSAADALSTH